MCTLALFRQCSRRYPLLLAANRDEFLSRPTAGPTALGQQPVMLAGKDLEAGGSWLGWRTAPPFLVAAVLNRRGGETLSVAPGARSRGLLCTSALGVATLEDAKQRIEAEDLSSYGPFHLLLAGLERAVLLNNDLRDNPPHVATELAGGLTVLTNLPLGDGHCPRLASARVDFERLGELLATDPPLEALVHATAAVLGNHDNNVSPDHPSPLARLCVHTEGYGTRSSTILVVDAGGKLRAFHAAGAPCSTSFVELGS